MLTDQDINVVLAFAQNNMKILTTAKAVYMNRNSIRYHLKKVKDHTGLNPHNFYDLIKLVDAIRIGEVPEQECGERNATY